MIPVITQLVELLKIESILGNEMPISHYVEGVIRERVAPLAAQVTITRVEKSFVVSYCKDSRFPTVAMIGHLDTVPGDEHGDAVRVDEQNVYGLGASDMKGGIAIMMECLRPEILNTARCNLVQVYYDGEEGPYTTNGLHAVFAANVLPKIDLSFVLEATDGAVRLGCLGVLNALLTVSGKRAHSATPWLGENAIYRSAELINRLAALKPKVVLNGGLEFLEVATLTTVKGGDAKNIVPARVEYNLNVRYAPGHTQELAKQWVRELVGELASIEFTDVAPPCSVPAHNPTYARFRDMFGLAEHPEQAYTDVAIFDLHGIPAINYGPGLASQRHQKGEYTPIRSVTECLSNFQRFLCEV